MSTSISERLVASVVIDQNGCWIWQKFIDPDGYGRISLSQPRRTPGAHRVSYQTFVGPIPDGMTVDHLCFVTACVNPEHLQLLTNRENAAKRRKWRYPQRHSPSTDPARCWRGHVKKVKANGRRVCVICKRMSRDLHRRTFYVSDEVAS